ncbi:hypothetical protein [Eubacterium sp. F2]|uniref:hypothetical protein n=1 Tax=Eubacterium sp. F2 TaxID=3381348 RepID=UPI003908106F
MTRTKSSRALLSVVLAVLMVAAFMPALTYSSFAATAKKATKVTKLTHTGAKVYGKVGNKYVLKYKLSPSKLTSAAKKTVWKSSDSSIVKVYSTKSNRAAVKAKAEGTAKVTVYTKANKKAKTTWTFKVTKKAETKTTLTGVTVSAPNAKDPAKELTIGTELQAKVEPSDAKGVTYQWYADDKAIEGATSANFTVTTDQIGKAITVKATSKNDVTSTATAKVTGVTLKTAEMKTVNDDAATAKTKPYNDSTTYNVGETEAVVLKDDASTPNTLDSSVASYQWYRSGTVNNATVDTAISGATSSTYKLTSADKGYTVYCIVTPKANVTVKAATQYDGKTIKVNGGAVVSKISGVAIKDGTKTVTGKTVLTGTALTASVKPAAAADDVTYQWYSVKTASDKPETVSAISGATSASYTPTVEGTYEVQISVKSGSVWTFADNSAYKARVTVNAKGTKTATITRAWNADAAASQDTATPRSDNQVGDTLKVTVPTELVNNAKIQWFVDGVKDANGNDIALADEANITAATTTQKIPATYTDKDSKAQSLVGQKIYAVVTGTGDYAGTTAKTDSFTVAKKQLTAIAPTVTSPATVTLASSTTPTTVTLTGTLASNAKTTLTFTSPSAAYEIAKIVTDNSAANVNGSVVEVTGTPNFNVTVYFCKAGDTAKDTSSIAPVTYSVNMSGVKVIG